MTLRLLYHLPLRQAEGFLHALFRMMRLDLSVPDYTTLSRRSQHLTRRLRPVPPGEGLHLVLDSTGLSIVGAGEWAAATHGGRGRRGWRKLHLGVDQSGVILVHTLTEATGDDATTALDLLNAVEGPLVRVTADAAYDTVAVYETATALGTTVVIPPAKTANISGHGPRSPARDRTVTLVKQLGRRRWKQVSGYHRQGRGTPRDVPRRSRCREPAGIVKLTLRPAQCRDEHSPAPATFGIAFRPKSSAMPSGSTTDTARASGMLRICLPNEESSCRTKPFGSGGGKFGPDLRSAVEAPTGSTRRHVVPG